MEVFRFYKFQYLQKMVFLDFSENRLRSVFGVITHIIKFFQTVQIQKRIKDDKFNRKADRISRQSKDGPSYITNRSVSLILLFQASNRREWIFQDLLATYSDFFSKSYEAIVSASYFLGKFNLRHSASAAFHSHLNQYFR